MGSSFRAIRSSAATLTATSSSFAATPTPDARPAALSLSSLFHAGWGDATEPAQCRGGPGPWPGLTTLWGGGRPRSRGHWTRPKGVPDEEVAAVRLRSLIAVAVPLLAERAAAQTPRPGLRGRQRGSEASTPTTHFEFNADEQPCRWRDRAGPPRASPVRPSLRLRARTVQLPSLRSTGQPGRHRASTSTIGGVGRRLPGLLS